MSKKILIADDDDRIMDLIRTTLEIEELDYVLIEARDGNEAMKAAIKEKPDLVILDIMMPGMSGYQVCKEIRSNPDTRHAYVLFLSARGGEISERTVEISGGDDFMTKPFVPNQLAAKVRKALKIN